MIPIIFGIFGLLLGFYSSPNPLVALILGPACALIGWSITGFKISEPAKTLSSTPATPMEIQTKAEYSSPTNPSNPTIGPSTFSLPIEDENSSRRWTRFKIKAFLVVGAVIIAANYERCTETANERAQRYNISSQRIKNISRDEAYEDCKSDGENEQECREAAQRAVDLAKQKTKSIYGQ